LTKKLNNTNNLAWLLKLNDTKEGLNVSEPSTILEPIKDSKDSDRPSRDNKDSVRPSKDNKVLARTSVYNSKVLDNKDLVRTLASKDNKDLTRTSVSKDNKVLDNKPSKENEDLVKTSASRDNKVSDNKPPKDKVLDNRTSNKDKTVPGPSKDYLRISFNNKHNKSNCNNNNSALLAKRIVIV